MADDKKPAKAKRKMLTPQERIAKAEADLKALVNKAQQKDRDSLKAAEAKAKDLAEKAAVAVSKSKAADDAVAAIKQRLAVNGPAPEDNDVKAAGN